MGDNKAAAKQLHALLMGISRDTEQLVRAATQDPEGMDTVYGADSIADILGEALRLARSIGSN